MKISVFFITHNGFEYGFNGFLETESSVTSISHVIVSPCLSDCPPNPPESPNKFDVEIN